jgi:hypothetical protein
MKNLKSLLAVAAVAAFGVALAPQAHAATSGNSTVTLNMGEFAQLQIVTSTLSLTPGQADFEAGYIEKTGSAGITVNVANNDDDGATLSVLGEAGDSRVSKITPGDIELKSTTTGGTGTYFAVTTSNQTIWANSAAKPNLGDAPAVEVDVKVSNLEDYIANTYNNQLTFSITPN